MLSCTIRLAVEMQSEDRATTEIYYARPVQLSQVPLMEYFMAFLISQINRQLLSLKVRGHARGSARLRSGITYQGGRVTCEYWPITFHCAGGIDCAEGKEVTC